MFEIYRRNEEFLPGHAASDIPWVNEVFQTKWLSLTYIAMLILSVNFIIQLWMCIKLNDHYYKQ